MTKKSNARLRRGQRKFPRRQDTVAVLQIGNKLLFFTNDMLVNQLQREGPKVARSFDLLAKQDIIECSHIFARCQARITLHLVQAGDPEFETTVARLLFSSLNAYAASLEVARHGYPRQYGASARLIVETLAVVLDISTVPESLDKFHNGKLNSTKSFSAAKKCLPMIGQMYGQLSNDFVHVGLGHTILEGPKSYKRGDESLGFITMMMRGLIVLIDVVADLIFGGDAGTPLYWKPEGEGWSFDPDPRIQSWMENALKLGR